jgi:ADP-ribosyl-[dinitrogen reductase] hydrolase
MPLEFKAKRPHDQLVRDMHAGRLAVGHFTDDTEMALALAESLLAHRSLNPTDLAQRFAAWYQSGPDDVGTHTAAVLSRVAAGEPWEQAVAAVHHLRSTTTGNGSVMRCWPVALAHWDDLDRLLWDSRMQSKVTHADPECIAGSGFVNVAIHHLIHGMERDAAVTQALQDAQVPGPLRTVIEAAPRRGRQSLENSGWVRHTLESVTWALLTTESFEEALVQAVNLGKDTDTAGAVIGALAGVAYGHGAIPDRWREVLHGEWPLGSGRLWRAGDLAVLADQLANES